MNNKTTNPNVLTTTEAEQLLSMTVSGATSWVIKRAYEEEVSSHFVWYSALRLASQQEERKTLEAKRDWGVK